MQRYMQLLAVLSAGLASAGPVVTPTPMQSLQPRQDPVVHCIDDDWEGEGRTTGNLVCVDPDSPGAPELCGDCLGQTGGPPYATSMGYQCYISNGHPDGFGNRTACPGDPPPSTAPDGSAVEVFDGVLDAFCSVAGDKGPFGFVTFAACYGFAYSQADNALEANEAGIDALCDTLFSGLCSYINSGGAPTDAD